MVASVIYGNQMDLVADCMKLIGRKDENYQE